MALNWIAWTCDHMERHQPDSFIPCQDCKATSPWRNGLKQTPLTDLTNEEEVFVRDEVLLAHIKASGPATIDGLSREVERQFGLVPVWRMVGLLNELLRAGAVQLYDDGESFEAVYPSPKYGPDDEEREDFHIDG